MADGIKVTVSGNALEKLEKYPAKVQGAVRSGLGDIAHEGADYIRQNYLHGQALDIISGQTEKSVKAFFSKKEEIWYIRPGVGIKGSLNYLAKWTGTSREFMKPGFQRFQTSRRLEDYIKKKVDKIR